MSQKSPSLPFTLNGKSYRNRRHAAEVLGISYPTLVSRLAAGWDEAKIVAPASFKNRSQSVKVAGVTYPSAKVMLSDQGLDAGSFYRLRRELDLSTEEAAEVMLAKRKKRAA